MDWEAVTYGDRIADVYDEMWADIMDPTDAVAFLAELAGKGPALELAIGTGRVALPLAERGVTVEGIDISKAMVEKLRAKPGGSDIKVAMGDFADVDVEGKFPLVYLVFNTLFALTSQEDQIRCFTNVAKHLTAEGVFVLEAFFPDVARFDRHQRVQVNSVDLGRASLDLSRHDPVHQMIDSQHVEMTEEGVRLFPVRLRYAWPSELDLMARLAGLRLRDRWGSWKREPFTSASYTHISVYQIDA